MALYLSKGVETFYTIRELKYCVLPAFKYIERNIIELKKTRYVYVQAV